MPKLPDVDGGKDCVRRRRELPPIVAGSFGGSCAAICSYPLDTLKVRVQAGRTANLLRGLLGGLTTPLAMVTPQWAMIFWGYRTGSDAYGPRPADGSWQWQRSALGGWTAGVACSVVYCPLQAVKCTSQVERCTPAAAIQRLWRFGGLRRGLYRGYIPTLVYELPGYAVFFTVFDGVLDRFTQQGEPGLSRVIVAAAVGSLAESTVGMPGDTVRTRYQTDLKHSSVRACATDLYRAEGMRGFYRGYPYRLAFGIVINASALAAIQAVNGWWTASSPSLY